MGFGGGARTPFYKTLPNRNLIATQEKPHIPVTRGPSRSSNMSQVNRNTQLIFAYNPCVILRVLGLLPDLKPTNHVTPENAKGSFLAYVYANGAYWPSPRGPSWAPKVATRSVHEFMQFSKIVLSPRERKRSKNLGPIGVSRIVNITQVF